MKQKYETRIEPAFLVESIISIHHGLHLQPNKGALPGDNGVVYDFWQLFFLESGSYTCQIEGCLPSPMVAGQLLICEPRKVRYSFENTDAVVGIINIRCGSPKLKQLKNRIFTLEGEALTSIYKLLDMGKEVFQKIPEDSHLTGQQPVSGTTDCQLQLFKNHIELLLIGLYAHFETEGTLLPPQKHYEVKFTQILEYMKAHIHEPLTIADICRGTGFSPRTVKRVFESQTDCGALHYFLKLKIGEAKSLLYETDLAVTEISDKLGFSSVHYFSRVFKNFTGISPTAYGKMHSHK